MENMHAEGLAQRLASRDPGPAGAVTGSQRNQGKAKVGMIPASPARLPSLPCFVAASGQ